MFSNFDTVQPDFGKVIHGAKANQENPAGFRPFGRDFKLQLVPGFACMISKTRIRLPGSRYSN